MKILYLYTELMGYNLPILERFVQRYQASVDVVRWNENKLTPFVPPAIEGVRFHERSTFTVPSLLRFAADLKPDLVYVSGWQDRGYLSVVAHLKAQGAVIITGMDSQWRGTFRQKLVAQWIRYLKKPACFSYAWVPGPLQYEFARRIGFKKTEILSNLLSGNSDVFALAGRSVDQDKQASYPKRFLYVGRFAESKGIDLLARAYARYQSHHGGDWSLTCVGNGPMEPTLREIPGIDVQGFASQEVLVQLARQAGALILPSRYEPWGVVVHEFASAGLPLILSEHVGARPQFLVDGLNGYTFYQDSVDALAHKMAQLAAHSDAQLLEMGRQSAALAKQLSPDVAAASFVSALSMKDGHDRHA